MTEVMNGDAEHDNKVGSNLLSHDCPTVSPKPHILELDTNDQAATGNNNVKSTNECNIAHDKLPPPAPLEHTGMTCSGCNIDMKFERADNWAVCQKCAEEGLQMYFCSICVNSNNKHQQHSKHMGNILVPWNSKDLFCWGCGCMCKNRNSLIYVCSVCRVRTCEQCHMWMHMHHRDYEEKHIRHQLVDTG
jgi:hypothetical protein